MEGQPSLTDRNTSVFSEFSIISEWGTSISSRAQCREPFALQHETKDNATSSSSKYDWTFHSVQRPHGMWHYTQVMSLGIFCINSRNKKDSKGWVKISTLVNLGHSKVRTAVWYALMIFCFLVTILSSSVQNLLPRNMNITFIHWIKEICWIWYREELAFHV